jgi:hypothetical protein
MLSVLALLVAAASWWIWSSRQRANDLPARGKPGPDRAELAKLRQKLLPQPKVSPRDVKNLAEFIDLYQGKDWVVRKTADGRVKRIVGLRIPLGELSPVKVLEFTQQIAPVFDLKNEELAQGVELLQDSPLLSPTEGVRGFRVRQYLDGYPVIDGSLKVFVDFADASVVVLEGGDVLRARGSLPKRPVIAAEQAFERARKGAKEQITSLTPSPKPEVGILPTGEAALVYRGMTGAPPKQPGNPGASTDEHHGGGMAEEVWLDATSGQVVRKRPMGIEG